MSNDEQATIIGRMVVKRLSAQSELALIRSRASEISEALLNVGNALRAGHFDNRSGVDENIAALPAKEEIRRLVDDARRAQRVMGEVSSFLADMGIKIE